MAEGGGKVYIQCRRPDPAIPEWAVSMHLLLFDDARGIRV